MHLTGTRYESALKSGLKELWNIKMCGRYGFAPGEFREIKLRFNIGGDMPLFKPRYNIAPTQQAPVIVNLEGGNRMELFQWGLVPSVAYVANGGLDSDQRQIGGDS